MSECEYEDEEDGDEEDQTTGIFDEFHVDFEVYSDVVESYITILFRLI